LNVSEVKDTAERMRAEIGKAIVGQADTIELMLIALMAGGHVLLEGVPGVAKTTLGKTFAHALGLEFLHQLDAGVAAANGIDDRPRGRTFFRQHWVCSRLLPEAGASL
jgi:MoxR-like ATPase